MKLNNIVILAILIRVLLMPFFYHPDTKSQYFHFQFFGYGVTNIYQYIFENRKTMPYQDNFNYLPLTYFTFGTINSILIHIMPTDYHNWINDWSDNQNNYANLAYFLLILKIPYLILDISIGFILYKITKSKKIQYIWLFNPFSFYLIYILGNFDILPTFLTLLSFYIQKNNPKISLIIFGTAIALKLYPIIFLPFFVFNLSKRPIEIIKNCIYVFIPLILSLIPFFKNYPFWQSFLGSGLTQKLIEIRFQNMPIFPIVYLVILVKTYFFKLNIQSAIFYTFLLFICTVNFHPQWLLWFLPFIFLTTNFSTKKYLVFFTCLLVPVFIYIILINDNYLFWGHLIPIDKEFINITSPYEVTRYKLLINPQLLQNQIKKIILAFSLIFFYIYEKNISSNHS